MQLLDRLGRPLRSLRVSVTDRCNFRCSYCMPEEQYVWLPRGNVLRFEEIGALCRVFARLGVDKIRLTGGEPLLRNDVPTLVRILAGLGVADLSLTTNGILLADQARALVEAGLDRVTVSLDTLRPERFRALTGRDALGAVLAGIDAALAAGFRPLKLDTVVLRGTNEDELGDLLAFAGEIGAEVRFIEYMDVGGATRWAPERVVSREEMLGALAARHGAIEPVGDRGSAPAERFRLPDGTVFGIIASTTAPFCGACDRGRLTADGMWLKCLYAAHGTDLRVLVRGGAGDDEIASAIARAGAARAAPGGAARRAPPPPGARGPGGALRRNPHLEMHTRGG